jgi:protein serine kinase H
MRRANSYSNEKKEDVNGNTSKFELKKLTLGKGNFSEVKLAIHPKTKLQVAAKVIDLLLWNKEYKNEIAVLQRLKHPSIIGLLDTERRCDGRGVIYLEYQSDPTLSFYVHNVSTLSETVAVDVLYSLVDAVHYLHSLGISHHDIKPDNILFKSVNHSIKLFDFGLSVCVNPAKPFSRCNAGSPLYMAPEVLIHDFHNVFYADIWSIGICLYEILAGKNPFATCKDIDELEVEWTNHKDISLPVFLCSSVLRNLYSQMVAYDPNKRISSGELKKILSKNTQKKCIGNSLRSSGEKKKAKRSSSVQGVIISIHNKKTKKKDVKKMK